MRISSILSVSYIPYISNVKKTKPIDSDVKEYLDNYENKSFEKQIKKEESNEVKLLNHQKIFSYKNIDDDSLVLNLSDDELLYKLENMLLNDMSTSHLKESFDELIKSNSISFGTHNKNSVGYVSYNKNDINNANIFISTEQSILGIATTLVHELQHHYDLNNTATQSNQSIDNYTLEVNAFAKEYEFLKNNYHLEDESYISLPKIAKDIYINSNSMQYQNVKSTNEVSFMAELLENIGYERDNMFQSKLIVNKEIELSKIIDNKSKLDSIIFYNKIGEKKQ
ncbi:MAG: hypothetical protein KAJ49_03040 [Arcobacteraceae bacterium]|nr:hypothetical protein [Arcobacteraceae bacterium]